MDRTGDSTFQALNRAYRRQFLLSGLLTCGCCGGGYTIVGKDRYGCATCRGRGTCDKGQTITRQHIEARVLGGLRSSLLTPERVEEYVRAFTAAWAELEREAGARRAQVKRALAEAERGLKGMVRAVEGGSWSEAIKTRLHDLENCKAQLKADLAEILALAAGRRRANKKNSPERVFAGSSGSRLSVGHATEIPSFDRAYITSYAAASRPSVF